MIVKVVIHTDMDGFKTAMIFKRERGKIESIRHVKAGRGLLLSLAGQMEGYYSARVDGTQLVLEQKMSPTDWYVG